jgi:Oxidoreductase molybdopterin binding domain
VAGKRTNLALAGLLTIAGVTGIVSYGIGTGPVRAVLVLHAVAALAIVVLVPWKTRIARRGLSRARRDRWLSIGLACFVVISIASGVAHTVFDARSFGPVSVMQTHVAAAVLTLLTAFLHVRHRPQRVRVTDLDRRTFLRTGGLAAAAFVGYALVESGTAAARLPGGNRRFTGSHERGSFDPAAMPVTSWFNDAVPGSPSHGITLRQPDGAVELSVSEVAAFADRVTATLDCTGGWYATQEWSGSLVGRLVATSAGSIRVVSATGYERRFPGAAAHRLLLATHAGGEPLSAGHGAPVRLVAPGRRGFWWVKWVSEIVVDDRPAWWQPPFPLS